ncbi:MAG: hypothetical protein LBG60_03500 [Bifidobacteriaceae bacterium]|jgi:uncharacterized protein with PQ loop repeat|nr:hypothetical protein [Bifidobacteriaceae bacterium]
MTFGLILGWLGALTAVSASLPQVVRLIRTGDVTGVSPAGWTFSLGSAIAWEIHGLRLGLPNLVAPNLVVMVSTAAILYHLYRAGGPRPRLWLVWRLGQAVAVGAALALVDHGLGSVWFGLLVPIPGAVGLLAQASALVRCASVTGVSLPTLALTAANTAVWAAWGLIAAEPGTAIASLIGGGLALFNLTWRILRSLGLRPLGTPAGGAKSARRRPPRSSPAAKGRRPAPPRRHDIRRRAQPDRARPARAAARQGRRHRR